MLETVSIASVCNIKGVGEIVGFPLPKDQYCNEFFDREELISIVLHELAMNEELHFYEIRGRDHENETITLVAVQSKYNQAGKVETCNRMFKRKEIVTNKEIINRNIKELCEGISYSDTYYPFNIWQDNTKKSYNTSTAKEKQKIKVNGELYLGKDLKTAYKALKDNNYSDEVIAYVLHNSGLYKKVEIGALFYQKNKNSPDESCLYRKMDSLIKKCENINIIIN